MTPRHFQEIWNHYLAAEERRDNRAIMISVSSYNAFGAKKADGSPITAADFKPMAPGQGQREQYGTQTTEQKIAIAKAFIEQCRAMIGAAGG